MKRLVGYLLVILFTLSVSAPLAHSAVTPGSKCSKTGVKQVFRGKTYTCIKLGKKLYWNNGVVVKVTSLPSPTVTVIAIPSPAPTVTVTAIPSPAPTVTVTATPSPAPTVTVTATPSPTVTVIATPSPAPTVTSLCPVTLKNPLPYASKRFALVGLFFSKDSLGYLVGTFKIRNDNVSSWKSISFSLIVQDSSNQSNIFSVNFIPNVIPYLGTELLPGEWMPGQTRTFIVPAKTFLNCSTAFVYSSGSFV